jgi:adenine deaminase
MKILIREGSAAKNFEALIDLLNDFPDEDHVLQR